MDWKQAALEHALEDETVEAVGFVVGGEYVRGVNTHPNPSTDFKTTPPDDGQFDAVVHSHPNGKHYPTKADMQSQLAVGKPFYIVTIDHENGHEVFGFGDQLPIPQLLGRPFRHGVTDCYSLCRDYYRSKGIRLPEFPRDWQWWTGENPQEMYLENFAANGFVEIPLSEVRPGDGFLASVGSETCNHAGVFVENGLILHHTTSRDSGYDPSKLSARVPAHRFNKFYRKALRYEGDQA